MPTSGDLSVLILRLDDEEEPVGENWVSVRSDMLDEESGIKENLFNT